MKKSTLITTIAMIVVVVVALSTATYAWFTSSSQSTAEGQISVTANSTWAIMGAQVSEGETTTQDIVAYDANTTISLVLMNGLYSPTAPISGTITGYSYSASYSALNTWYNANQKGTGEQGTATITNAAAIKPVGVVTEQRSPISYIRVENGKTDPANLQLTITVYMASGTSLQEAAAKQLCTYIAANIQSGDSTGNSFVANTAYDYGDLTESTASKAGAIGTYSVPASDGTNGTLEITGNRTFVDATVGAPLNAKYITGDTDITTGKYYQLKVVFANVPVGYGVNIAMYTWFNGWKIDSTSTGTNANVYLAFGDADV